MIASGTIFRSSSVGGSLARQPCRSSGSGAASGDAAAAARGGLERCSCGLMKAGFGARHACPSEGRCTCPVHPAVAGKRQRHTNRRNRDIRRAGRRGGALPPACDVEASSRPVINGTVSIRAWERAVVLGPSARPRKRARGRFTPFICASCAAFKVTDRQTD